MLNFCLNREEYFVIRGSLDSNSALTCPTTSRELLRIKRLSAPTTSASSKPAIMASYSDSLLEALKPKRTACSILSPVREVNCRPMLAPDCLKAPSTQKVHHPFSSGQVSGYGIYAMKSGKTCPSLKASTCTGCHSRLVPLPNRPSVRTYPVYESCIGVEDQSAPRRDEPGSIGEASGQLFVGPRQLVPGGCIWFSRRLRIC